MKLQARNLRNNVLAKKLRRHPWLAGVTGGGVFIALASFAFFLPPVYRSSATVRATKAENLSLEFVNREALSDTNLIKMIKEFELAHDYSLDSPEQAIDRVRKAITVESSKGELTEKHFFTVSFTGTDPQKTMKVTNALAALYSSRTPSVRELSASTIPRVSHAENPQTSRLIEEQQRQIQQYTERYRDELPEQLENNKKIIVNLQEQIQTLSDDVKRKREQRTNLANKTASLGEATPKPSDATLTALVRYASDLRQELTILRNRHGDAHPEVFRARQELEALDVRIKFRSKRLKGASSGASQHGSDGKTNGSLALGELDSEISRIEAVRNKLEQQLQEQQQYINNTPKREKELQTLILTKENLQKGTATKSELPSEVTERELETSEGVRFQIIQPATASPVPFGPQRAPLFCLALVLGVGTACGSVVIWEKFFDTSFHSANDLETAMQFPVLVTIPRIAEGGAQRLRS